MLTIKELIQGFVIVAVRYHNYQKKIARTAIELESEVNALLNEQDLNTKLINLIDSSMIANYDERRELLNFIREEVVKLKIFEQRIEPFTEKEEDDDDESNKELDELSKYKRKIEQLLFDLQKLILTPKNTDYQVTIMDYNQDAINGTKLSLKGLGANWRSYICESGTYVKEEILNKAGMLESLLDKSAPLDQQIRARAQRAATELCDTHQKELLAAQALQYKSERDAAKKRLGLLDKYSADHKEVVTQFLLQNTLFATVTALAKRRQQTVDKLMPAAAKP